MECAGSRSGNAAARESMRCFGAGGFGRAWRRRTSAVSESVSAKKRASLPASKPQKACAMLRRTSARRAFVTAKWFDGFSRVLPHEFRSVGPPGAAPKTWLLAFGWKQRGLIDWREGPARWILLCVARDTLGPTQAPEQNPEHAGTVGASGRARGVAGTAGCWPSSLSMPQLDAEGCDGICRGAYHQSTQLCSQGLLRQHFVNGKVPWLARD